ncbi:MAG TPA: type II toxin-antitoxin system VapC family toxin, partial [Terracidiphilus sp.]|nr:type II toxin-antitoxin system VapC family toxin [Terracidiphilus sp.]
MILVDANIFLDIWDPDPVWHPWSAGQLRSQSTLHELAIDPIIYSEVSVSFAKPSSLDQKLEELGVSVLDIPRDAAFLAGKAHQVYRRRGGTKVNVLSDFFIAAHAASLHCEILTRDPRLYLAYFP